MSQTKVNRIWRLHGLAPHRDTSELRPSGAEPAPGEAVPTADDKGAVAPDGDVELIVQLRRDLAGLAQMLKAANPAALRVAVDAVEAAFVAAAGSAGPQRRAAGGLPPETRARTEARWRRARALFEQAKATLADTEGGAGVSGSGEAGPRRPRD